MRQALFPLLLLLLIGCPAGAECSSGRCDAGSCVPDTLCGD